MLGLMYDPRLNKGRPRTQWFILQSSGFTLLQQFWCSPSFLPLPIQLLSIFSSSSYKLSSMLIQQNPNSTAFPLAQIASPNHLVSINIDFGKVPDSHQFSYSFIDYIPPHTVFFPTLLENKNKTLVCRRCYQDLVMDEWISSDKQIHNET